MNMSNVKTTAYIMCFCCTHLPSKYYLSGFVSYLLSIKIQLDKMTMTFGMSSVFDMSFKGFGGDETFEKTQFHNRVVGNRSIIKEITSPSSGQ